LFEVLLGAFYDSKNMGIRIGNALNK